MTKENVVVRPQKTYIRYGSHLKKVIDENNVEYAQYYNVVSQSRNPLKNLMKKVFFKKDYKNPASSTDSQFRGSLLDSYLSRILHKIIPHAPKGKFVKGGAYVSRVYTLDGSINHGAGIETLTLEDLFHGKHVSGRVLRGVTKLDGLLKAIVFNIVTENWDSKLRNMTAYPTAKQDVFKVAAFDLEYALQNGKKYRWDSSGRRQRKNRKGGHRGNPQTKRPYISCRNCPGERVVPARGQVLKIYKRIH